MTLNNPSKQEAKRAVSEVRDQYLKIIDSSTDSQGLPKRIKNINTAPKALGDFGEIERFMKEYLNQIASQRNDYLLELEAIGWPSILDMNRIKADNTFIESKLIIKKTKEVVKKYTAETTVLMSSFRNNIGFLNVSNSLKNEMLMGFDRGLVRSKRDADETWLLEADIINEFEKIILLLATEKKNWVIQGEQVLFYKDSDLQKFNRYLATIQNIMVRQEKIKELSFQSVNQTFDKITK